MNPNEPQTTGPNPQIAAAPQTPIARPTPQPQPAPVAGTPIQTQKKPTDNNSILTIFLIFGIVTLLVISIILFTTIFNH